MKSDFISIERYSKAFAGVSFLLLLIGAFVYSKERIIHLDGSFYIFYLIQNGSFITPNDRFSAVLLEIFPYFMLKLNMPLNVIITAYSVNLILWPLVVYLIVGFVLKEWVLATIIPLTILLFSSDLFFYPISELKGSLPLFVLLYALLHSQRQLTIRHFVILSVVLILIVYFHPLVIIPLIFVFVLLSVSSSAISFRTMLVVLCLFLTIYLLKNVLLSPSDYDTQRVGTLKVFWDLFPNYFTLNSNRMFFSDWRHNYSIILFIFISIIALFENRRNFALWLCLLFVLGYLGLINVSLHDGVERFYFANMYAPIALFIAFGLVLFIRSKLDLLNQRNLNFIAIGTGIFLFVKFFDVINNGNFYKERLNWIIDVNEELAERNIDKAILQMNNSRHRYLLKMDWAIGMESLLISSYSNPLSAKTFVINPENEYLRNEALSNSVFINEWELIAIEKLKSEYFKLNDGPYVLLDSYKGYGE